MAFNRRLFADDQALEDLVLPMRKFLQGHYRYSEAIFISPAWLDDVIFQSLASRKAIERLKCRQPQSKLQRNFAGSFQVSVMLLEARYD